MGLPKLSATEVAAVEVEMEEKVDEVAEAVVEVVSLDALETATVHSLAAKLEMILIVLLAVGSCTKRRVKPLMFAPAGRILTSGTALTMLISILAPLISLFTIQPTSVTAWKQPLFIPPLGPLMPGIAVRDATSTLSKLTSCLLATIVF